MILRLHNAKIYNAEYPLSEEVSIPVIETVLAALGKAPKHIYCHHFQTNSDSSLLPFLMFFENKKKLYHVPRKKQDFLTRKFI